MQCICCIHCGTNNIHILLRSSESEVSEKFRRCQDGLTLMQTMLHEDEESFEDLALAMYIVKYEELRYVVAEHTADESLRLVLVGTSFVFAF